MGENDLRGNPLHNPSLLGPFMLCVATVGAGPHELIPSHSQTFNVCSIHYEILGDLFLSMGIELGVWECRRPGIKLSAMLCSLESKIHHLKA